HLATVVLAAPSRSESVHRSTADDSRYLRDHPPSQVGGRHENNEEVSMRIFMTGVTGVVGRRLVPLLQNAGHEVTAAARSSAARAELTTKGVRAIEVDVFDAGAVSRVVAGRDVVVNLATHIPDPSRMFLPWAWRENDRLRRVASAILVDASLASTV